MTDVFFDDDDLLRLLNFTGDEVKVKYTTEVKVKYHGDGPAMLGCHDLSISCIQFTHDAAFARIEHSTASTYDLQMTLRTLKSDCILTYTETAAYTERGYVQVSCSTASNDSPNYKIQRKSTVMIDVFLIFKPHVFKVFGNLLFHAVINHIVQSAFIK